MHGFMLTPDTVLTSGAPLTIDGAEDSVGYANFTVPAGAQILQVTFRGGTGDADLDLFDPDGVDYFSTRDGNNETLSVSAPKSGKWRIEGTGYEAFAGVSITASLVTPLTLTANTPLSGLNDLAGSEHFYKLPVPAGATSLNFATSGSSGDVDLYVKYGRPASCQSSFVVFEPCTRDSSSTNIGNTESVTVSNPQAGDWYVDVVRVLQIHGGHDHGDNHGASVAFRDAGGISFYGGRGSGAAPAGQTLARSPDPSGSAFAWTARRRQPYCERRNLADDFQRLRHG